MSAKSRKEVLEQARQRYGKRGRCAVSMQTQNRSGSRQPDRMNASSSKVRPSEGGRAECSLSTTTGRALQSESSASSGGYAGRLLLSTSGSLGAVTGLHGRAIRLGAIPRERHVAAAESRSRVRSRDDLRGSRGAPTRSRNNVAHRAGKPIIYGLGGSRQGGLRCRFALCARSRAASSSGRCSSAHRQIASRGSIRLRPSGVREYSTIGGTTG